MPPAVPCFPTPFRVRNLVSIRESYLQTQLDGQLRGQVALSRLFSTQARGLEQTPWPCYFDMAWSIVDHAWSYEIYMTF